MSSFDLRRIAEKNGFQAIDSKNLKELKTSANEKMSLYFRSLYLVGHALSMN